MPLLDFKLSGALIPYRELENKKNNFCWLGMLPGTWAYVSADAFGQAIIVTRESEFGLPGGNGQLLTLGLGLLATALAAAYVTRLAKDAIKDTE
uniref:Uncharacterized protein n=1 Tax=Vitis vinifera TaxID=29760 RepID=F6HK33_VITVI